AQMSLAWVLRLQEVTSVILGASSVKQIDNNIAALQNTGFTQAELDEIDYCLNPDTEME
ncbi:MAG: aldo/keto reductase, partial [Balneolaceae bacterium]